MRTTITQLIPLLFVPGSALLTRGSIGTTSSSLRPFSPLTAHVNLRLSVQLRASGWRRFLVGLRTLLSLVNFLITILMA